MSSSQRFAEASKTVAFMVLVLGCFARTVYAQSFEKGVRLERAGDLAAAREEYEKVLAAAPNRVDALANLGAVLLRLGDSRNAITRFKQALAQRPTLPGVRFYLALALYQAGQPAESRIELKRVLAIQVADGRSLHLDGLCLLKLGDLRGGSAVLQRALAAQPENLTAALTLATTYVSLGEIERAEALLAGPLRQTEGAETQLVQGMILNRRGRYREAEQILGQARAGNPALPTLHNQLGYTLMLLGDYPSAVKEFQEELRISPNDFNASANLGWIYVQNREFDEAAPLLAEALRQKPDTTGLLYLMGQVLLARGDLPKAASALEKAVSQQPDFRAAQVLLARVYARQSRSADVARVQVIIARLNQEEQTRSLQSQEGYGDQVLPVPAFENAVPVRRKP